MPDRKVECWGCECGVPIVRGRHVEETDIPGTVYTYPCKRALTPVAPGIERDEDGMPTRIVMGPRG